MKALIFVGLLITSACNQPEKEFAWNTNPHDLSDDDLSAYIDAQRRECKYLAAKGPCARVARAEAVRNSRH